MSNKKKCEKGVYIKGVPDHCWCEACNRDRRITQLIEDYGAGLIKVGVAIALFVTIAYSVSRFMMKF